MNRRLHTSAQLPSRAAARPPAWLLALLGVLLAAWLPSSASAAHSADFPGDKYQHPFINISTNGDLFKPGDTVVVTVTCNSAYWCQSLILGVPGAISATLDGVPAGPSGASYYDHLFDANPHPNPAGCYFINYPGGVGTHTAEFKLGDDANGKFTKTTGSNGVVQISGPFVIVDRPQYQMFSSLKAIEIEGVKRDFSLTKTAQAPHTDGVKPEEFVTYTLTAKAPSDAKQIVINDALAAGVTLDGSLNGGVVTGKNLKWTINGGGTVTRSYRVKVDKYRDLPRGAKKLATGASAQASLASGRKYSAKASNTVNLILPWTIAGLTRDIQFDFLKSQTVTLKRVTPKVDVELIDASGRVVDTAEGNASGAFELHAREPGKHTIRGKAKGDRFAAGTSNAVMPNGADIFGGGKVEVLAADPPSKTYKQDIYVPVSLNNHVVEQLRKLRDFKAVVGNLFGFDYTDDSVQGLLAQVGLQRDFSEPYVVDEAVNLLDEAQKFNGFVNNSGEPVFFTKLYDGTGDKDGWSAVVRLSAFIDMLALRQSEYAKISDKAGLAIAKGITLAIVTGQGQKRAEKVQQLIADKRFSELPAKANSTVEALKIGTLGFGVGTALPVFLDKLGYTGAQKARLIEIVAKLARYLPDLILYKLLPGKLLDDVTFELIFQPLRFLTVVGLQDVYIQETQDDFNAIASTLRLGVYSENTAQILDALDAENSRIKERSDYSIGIINSILGVTSFSRALDGVLFKLQKPLGDLAAKGVLGKLVAVPLQGAASILTDGGGLVPEKKFGAFKLVDTGKMTNAVTPLKTTVLVASIGSVIEITLWEYVLRDRDVLGFRGLCFDGKFSDGTSAIHHAASAHGALTRAEFSPASPGAFAPQRRGAPTFDPLSPAAKYLAALEAVSDEIDSRATGDLRPMQLNLLTTRDAFLAPLIALHDRLTFTAQAQAEDEQADARRFVLAVEQLCMRSGEAHQGLEILPKAPDKALTALARSRVKTLVGAINVLADVLALADPLAASTANFAGQLRLRSGPPPSDAAVLSGQPFDLTLEVRNVGGAATGNASVALLPGVDLVLVSADTASVGPLAPGASALITWSVKSRAVDPAGQALSYSATIGGTAGVNALFSDFLLAQP